MHTNPITHEFLKELFSYDKDTGLFTRVSFRRGKNGAIGCIAGTVGSNGYVMINILGSIYSAHRLAWYYVTGEYPAHHIDHIDQDKQNNRWSNLREANHAINARNMPMRSNNKSGQVGVSWDKAKNKWYVRINTNGKSKFLGYRIDLDDAIALRKEAEVTYGYHSNHGSCTKNVQ